MGGRNVTRWQASGLHLLISAAVGAAALAVMLFGWYPPPLFEAEGGTQLLFILLAVDVVLGPLITLIIFRQGKRGLRLDLFLIGATQVAALAYGLYVVFAARPAFIVFVVDHFEIARAVDLEEGNLAKARYPQFRRPPIDGPRLAVAEVPKDPAKRSELALKAMSGIDLQAFPELWFPYAERRQQVLARAVTLEGARRTEPRSVKVLEEWLGRSGRNPAEVRYLLLRARKAWVWVVVDAATADPVTMLIAERI